MIIIIFFTVKFLKNKQSMKNEKDIYEDKTLQEENEIVAKEGKIK